MCEVLNDLLSLILWFANFVASLIGISSFGNLWPIMGALYLRDLKKLTISYPCVMLNVDVAMNNTNDQYQVNDQHNSFSLCCIY